ncbi:hypothetical protein K501DRAFT_278688 [Backusella circina FSU 941]|nr:hypothetical protein K501DRAFT_278688 [Backusella circina FSU 941]
MPYNNRRVVNTQMSADNIYRFSNLEKKKNTQGGAQFGNTNSGGAATGGTVFSRLRGGKTTLAKGRVNAIQSRLGKTKNGGIKKNAGNFGKNAKGGDKLATKNAVSGRRKGGAAVAASKPGAKKSRNVKEKKKPLTAEDLDKQMDAYMMKDKKSAQAKLDDELNSYMADAPAIDLEELS